MIIETADGTFVARIDAMPGFSAEGATAEEAKRLLFDAIEENTSLQGVNVTFDGEEIVEEESSPE